MSKKSLTIFLSIILIGAFFLPYLSGNGISYSGFTVVFGNEEVLGLSNAGRSLYACLLIPLSAVLLLIGRLTNDNFASAGFIYWLPLVGVVFILVMLYTQGGGIGIREFVDLFGYGLWITLFSSILLPFTRSNT